MPLIFVLVLLISRNNFSNADWLDELALFAVDEFSHVGGVETFSLNRTPRYLFNQISHELQILI
jgi:hypothetical protein